MENRMRLRDSEDDPEALPTEEERRAAAALRKTLGGDSASTPSHQTAPIGAAPAVAPSRNSPSPSRDAALAELAPEASTRSPVAAPQSNEGRWLAAHLRYPKPEDSLGEVKARRLARMAREAVQQRQQRSSQRASSWARLGRSLSSTAGLLGAAGLLLLISWLILDQGDPRKQARVDTGTSTVRLPRMMPPPLRVATALLLRHSLAKGEDPAQRLDLMIQRRLSELRGAMPEPVAGGRGLANVAASPWMFERERGGQ